MSREAPDSVRRLRTRWRWRGDERPPFAETPAPGQESVWDYPRPPRLAPDGRLIEVRAAGIEVARSRDAVRILETASPPAFYLPPRDVRMDLLEPSSTHSTCEWKGRAAYGSVRTPGGLVVDAAWSYPEPFEGMEPLAAYVSFYPARLACFVAGERVEPQPGGFYGGWMTSEIVGPVKGGPGTGGW